MPKRARSYRGAPVVIISIAQQARPKVAGQNELLRMYPASISTEVSMKPLGSFSSIPIYRSLLVVAGGVSAVKA